MSWKRALALSCLLALLAPGANAGKPKPGWMKKPGTATMPAFHAVAAGGSCGSWGWAAATQSILALDQVKVDQRELLQKAFGGELCEDRLNLGAMAAVVNGDYTLGPKKGMKVVTRVFPAGAPLGEDVIAAIRRERPMIIFWKMHPYVAVGAEYDEYIGANGTRMFDVQKLTLFDPIAEDEAHRQVTFDKTQDDPGELTGAMEYVLFPVEQVDWEPQD